MNSIPSTHSSQVYLGTREDSISHTPLHSLSVRLTSSHSLAHMLRPVDNEPVSDRGKHVGVPGGAGGGVGAGEGAGVGVGAGTR